MVKSDTVNDRNAFVSPSSFFAIDLKSIETLHIRKKYKGVVRVTRNVINS